MSHEAEIAINAVNVGLSLIIVLFLFALARTARQQGLQVVGARLFLREKAALQAITLIIAGLTIFIASNVLELHGDVFHIDWYVNEIVETLSLLPMIAGLARCQSILRVPAIARQASSTDASEAIVR